LTAGVIAMIATGIVIAVVTKRVGGTVTASAVAIRREVRAASGIVTAVRAKRTGPDRRSRQMRRVSSLPSPT